MGNLVFRASVLSSKTSNKARATAIFSEFLWKLSISMALDEEDEEFNPEADSKSNLEIIRDISSEFPNLVYPKGKSICTVEIDVDGLSSEGGKYNYGGWADLIRQITAKWVKENSFSGNGTIWAWGTPSVNFHHQSFSMFYAVLGMPKKFREYLGREISVLGKHVRPYSDYVVPNLEDGWDARCHIEEGKVWMPLDEVSWEEVKA